MRCGRLALLARFGSSSTSPAPSDLFARQSAVFTHYCFDLKDKKTVKGERRSKLNDKFMSAFSRNFPEGRPAGSADGGWVRGKLPPFHEFLGKNHLLGLW